jgi:hypothetical protein
MPDDGRVREPGGVEWDRSLSLWVEPTTEEEMRREEEWILADGARMRKVALASDIRHLALAWAVPAGCSAAAGDGRVIRLALLA